MNIFYLDENPEIAAKYHCDKHVVKMILETAQMLCTTYQLQGIEASYKATHKNHPSTIWVRSSSENFLWLCRLGLSLCIEYTNRYGKVHKSQDVIIECLDNSHKLSFPSSLFTVPPLAMPEKYKIKNSHKPHNAVMSYRDYYVNEKSGIAEWKFTNKPEWFSQMQDYYEQA